MLRSPGGFLLGIWEVTASWARSRNWWSLFYLTPITVMLAIVGYCWLASRRDSPEELLASYWQLIDADTNATDQRQNRDESSSDLELQSASAHRRPDSQDQPLVSEESDLSAEVVAEPRFSEALIRKALILDRSNTRAIYVAAKSLGKTGKTQQAQKIMRGIAPKNGRGYPPAHAWLAADRLQRYGVQSPSELDTLLNDLSQARSWKGVDLWLMSVYADLLVKKGESIQAIEVLQSVQDREPTLIVSIAALAKQQQRNDLLQKISEDIQADQQEKIDKGNGTEQDFIVAASVALLNEQFDQAMLLARQGVQQFPQGAKIRRVLSNVYIGKFEQSLKSPSNDRDLKLELLDIAMKADPTNPAVMEKVGELAARQSLTSQQVASKFRELLASGRATAVSHLLLAIGQLRENNLQEAAVHLELALTLAPNNPIVLNNLALCLARLDQKNLPRAKEFIERALKVAGPDAERLDTYGEILAASGESLAAIRAFESALALDPTRDGTRQKLASEYEKLEMTDMAEAVLQPVREKQGQPDPKQAVPNDDNDPVVSIGAE